ncbi:F-box protein At3g58530-like [Chenopodium quinoa]|uniref:F-box protein At3g58530-like n=1 Tax=Chenopodium quinoa TaxID=63459 RepID=UPI000B774E46|nr:F-box protein At3g58530-like [Chenopodium quinoa]
MEHNFNGGEEESPKELPQLQWRKETVPRVFTIVSSKLPQRDLVSLLLVSPWLYRTLASNPSLWKVLDFHEMNNAGNRLVAALSLPRYKDVKQINLEFAQDLEDKYLELLKNKCSSSLQNLEILNLNGCQKISDQGVEAITSACPSMRVFSIYWNVRVTDVGTQYLVRNCKHVIDLNFSGCKNISDKSMQLVADAYQKLESLNITRCIKLSDSGLQYILRSCSSLKSLNLYALSSFTDEVYMSMSLLTQLRFLDLCGAQNLSDQGLMCIAKCNYLVYLNLSWCVRATDAGVIALAEGCSYLELLSLFGILGVTDQSLEALSRSCSSTLKTLDVNGCINIKRRTREELLQLFPLLECFKVHS